MNDSLFVQNRDALYNLISGSNDVGIVISEQQTLDQMGAALAFYLSLQEAGKNPQAISKKDPIVEISHLVGIDRVKKSFDGLTRMVILSIPYKEGEVEKVSFTTEGSRMNFNIVGGENGISPFDIKDVRINRQGSTPSTIVTVGISREDELRDLFEPTPDTKIVNIDNKTMNTLFGDIVLVDPAFSSVSEIVTRLIEELSLPLDVDIAQNLLDGVIYATKNFSLPETTTYAFESAAVLIRQGALRKDTGKRAPGRVSSPSPVRQPREEIVSPGQTVENNQELSDKEVPSDWFVPKVFKGAKQQS